MKWIPALVSDSGFSLERNDMVNASTQSHKTPVIPKHAHKTSIIPKHTHKEVPSKYTSAITHEEEKVALVIVLTSALGIWYSLSLMRGTRRGDP